MSSGGEDLLRTLHRRADVLDTLTDRPRDRADLVDELGVSRSTIDRALRELEASNCVTREDGRYVTTLVGRVLLDAYATHVGQVGGIARVADVLAELPRSAPISPEAIADATILRPEPPATHTPHEALEHIVDSSSRCFGFSVATTNTRTVSVVRDRALDGVPIDIVVTSDMARTVRTDFTEPVSEAMTDGTLSLYERDDLPFGMLIGDREDRTRVAIVVYGPRYELAGIVLNDTPEIAIWAKVLYRSYRRDATPIDPTSLE